MSKNKIKAWCRHNAPSLALAAAGMAALCLFWLCRDNRALMQGWLTHVSMPFKRVVSAVVNPLPFSACEAGVTLLILLELVLLGLCISRAVHRRAAGFAAWLAQFTAVAVWVYVLVCAFWGTQYYGATFAEQAGMADAPVSVEDLQAVTAYFAAQVNATANTISRDASGLFAVDRGTILATSAGSYDAVVERYPFLQAPERRAKPAFYSKLMSAAGFTGYLCPLFGESTVNVDCPAVFLPVTVTHEFSHQRGVAAEQEANFVGVLAAVTCDDPMYNYSGWLFGYLHLSNALYRTDADAYWAIADTLCLRAQADLGINNVYWAQWEGPAKTAGEKVYTTFLNGYDQPLGMQSYGACVDLLVEEYLPLATA